MALKRNVTVSKWIALNELEGEVLTKPLTGKIEAEYNKRMGLAPDMRQEQATGDERAKSIVRIEIDPLDAYNAGLWLMGELIEDVKGQWEDGADYVVDEELFTGIIDGGDFDEWITAARKHGSRRAEVAEKN
jgi:hypothetical protein